MRSLWPQLGAWLDDGRRFALATVVASEGSSPREVGSVMAIDPAGPHFIGSVSSGCLEIEVIENAPAVLEAGCVRHLHFGPEATPVWNDGLTCGGKVRVRLEPWWGSLGTDAGRLVASEWRRWSEQDQSGLIISNGTDHLAITEQQIVGAKTGWPTELLSRAGALLSSSVSAGEVELAGISVLVRPVLCRPQLLIVGAGEVAVKLVQLAQAAGWKTIVIDPRAAYLKPERFAVPPDELIAAWPQDVIAGLTLGPRDAAVALTHDAKVDDPALIALARTRAGYIGALGSRQSHIARIGRLRQAGSGDELIGRIRSPCGIHLGAANAVGIAAGILAGLVQWQHGGARCDTAARFESTIGPPQ